MATQLTQLALKSTKNVLRRQGPVTFLLRSMSGANPQIQANQKKFQKDDGTPVHVKGGMGDQVLYRTTMGLCVLGVILFGFNAVQMAVAKK